jgi:mannose-1-phosphate guanylyltransferase
MKLPKFLNPNQLIGDNHIDPSAKISATAIIGPNVSIGAKAHIHDGVRISNSIILEDVEIFDNTFVTCSLIGWNSKIGPWCRLEGSI